MKIVRIIAATAAFAVAVGTAALTASPAVAQLPYPHPYHPHPYHPHQYRHANHLDRRAYVAASRGHYRRAATLRHHASAIRTAARHGF